MSRELSLLVKEYEKKSSIVLRKDLNLYQASIGTVSSSFLREVDYKSKKMKQANVVLIAVIPEPDKDHG